MTAIHAPPYTLGMVQLLATPLEPVPRSMLPRDDVTKILLVEDDELIRALTKLALRQRGYAVIEASDFAEASRLWYENTGSVKLAIIDVQLGAGPNGLQLAERFHRLDPAVNIILISGGSMDDRNPVFGALQKPFNVSRLCEAVGAALAEVLV